MTTRQLRAAEAYAQLCRRVVATQNKVAALSDELAELLATQTKVTALSDELAELGLPRVREKLARAQAALQPLRKKQAALRKRLQARRGGLQPVFWTHVRRF